MRRERGELGERERGFRRERERERVQETERVGVGGRVERERSQERGRTRERYHQAPVSSDTLQPMDRRPSVAYRSTLLISKRPPSRGTTGP